MDVEWIPDTALTQVILLLCAFVLSGVIGVEREIRQKSAGARTHLLVGMGSALFTLVSGYGFAAVLGGSDLPDPSRIAAQIVTGIGFLGAGVIFVRKNIVSGLTTAASIWVTAAVGMACGAGMPLVATVTVALYLLSVTVVNAVIRRIPHAQRSRAFTIRYADGQGVLRDILVLASDEGYEATLARTTRYQDDQGRYTVEASLRFTRRQGTVDADLPTRLSEVPGVVEIHAIDEEHD
ncbi:MAG: MgtC/SapB family protein [Micrococcaceae bacterium]